MSMPPERLEAEALKLPIRERASLAHRLLESLDEDPVETERRLAGHRAGQTFGPTDQQSATPSEPTVLDTKARYTPKQGQYLSFIYYYTRPTASLRRKPICSATSGRRHRRCIR